MPYYFCNGTATPVYFNVVLDYTGQLIKYPVVNPCSSITTLDQWQVDGGVYVTSDPGYASPIGHTSLDFSPGTHYYNWDGQSLTQGSSCISCTASAIPPKPVQEDNNYVWWTLIIVIILLLAMVMTTYFTAGRK